MSLTLPNDGTERAAYTVTVLNKEGATIAPADLPSPPAWSISNTSGAFVLTVAADSMSAKVAASVPLQDGQSTAVVVEVSPGAGGSPITASTSLGIAPPAPPPPPPDNTPASLELAETLEANT